MGSHRRVRAVVYLARMCLLAAVRGVALAWLLAGPALAAAPALGAVVPGGPPSTDEGEETLFAAPTTRDHVGRIVVRVTLNGQGPFRFVVDTGASRSAISPRLAQTLGLEPGAESVVELNGITGSALVPSVMIRTLQAGDLRIENTALPVVSAPVMAGADGILGAAGLNSNSLYVDFQRDRVSITSGGGWRTRQGYFRIHGSRVAGGLVALDATVDGVRVRAVIDTGSERTLGNVALRAAVDARRRARAEHAAKVYGATQEVASGDVQTTGVIVLDSVRIDDVPIVYGDFHIFRVWGLQNSPALVLGMDVLGTVDSLAVDFLHGDVYLTGPGAINTGSTPVRSILTDRPRR